MKLNLDDITFIIVTYKSENIIQNCLNSLPKNSKKIIIENEWKNRFYTALSWYVSKR